MGRESVGEFEHLVLLAILRLKDRAYGGSILDELTEHTDRRVLRPAVYSALRRLEAKALISSRLGEPTPERGGRAKRFFSLEPAGLTAVRESRRTLLSLWDGVDDVLDGAG
jgi:PadR family transcriptional regulator PadR